MPQQKSNGSQNKQARYGAKQPLPSMATPRKPVPKQKIGPGGYLFMVVILAGFIWLLMLIFGWGPYQAAAPESTGTPESALGLAETTPTLTVTISAQPTSTQTVTPTVTFTPTLALMPYILRGVPEHMDSVLIPPRLGCEWLIIAGQVWDLQDDPQVGLELHLSGELGGFSIDQVATTGSAIAYGPSGYEFTLEDLVVNSRNSLYLQLFDPDGQPLSHPYAIETFDDCQKNLILVNFQQVR